MNVTREELKLIDVHTNYYGAISKEQIKRAWRDEDGYLCVAYRMSDGSEEWYHYNGQDKEWW